MYMLQLRLETSSCYQICSYFLYSTTKIYTHKHCFNSHFPGKPESAVSPLKSELSISPLTQSHRVFFRLQCLPGYSKSNLHLHTLLEPVCIVITFNMSKLPQSSPLMLVAVFPVCRCLDIGRLNGGSRCRLQWNGSLSFNCHRRLVGLT